MLTKKEVYEIGYERGFNIASWQDLPEIGTIIRPFELEEFEGPVEDVEDAREVFLATCCSAENSNREFTPFEFTCKDLNDLQEKKPYDVWEVFEYAIGNGFRDNWESRKSYYDE